MYVKSGKLYIQAGGGNQSNNKASHIRTRCEESACPTVQLPYQEQGVGLALIKYVGHRQEKSKFVHRRK